MSRILSGFVDVRLFIQRKVRIGIVRASLGASFLAVSLTVSKPTLGGDLFVPLGFFGGVTSMATDVAADGSGVVGVASGPMIGTNVFRWSAANTFMRQSTSFDSAPAISADGSVVVGVSFTISGFEAYRWIPGGSFDLLGDLPGGSMSSAAVDVSEDGGLIVGYGTPSAPVLPFPVIWAPSTPSRLSGVGSGSALGVSADGNVVVGHADSEAFRRVGGIATGLGFLPGANSSSARRVSADGSVIVGVSSFPAVPPIAANLRGEAFRWTEAVGMVSLGDLLGGRTHSIAYDVSADGSVIVGTGETAFDGTNGTSEAFYWTAGTGMLNLREVLVAGGATGLDGWTLIEARGVSWDGLTIVGTGVHDGATEAFVATIPEPSTLALAALATSMCLIIRLRGAKSRLAAGR